MPPPADDHSTLGRAVGWLQRRAERVALAAVVTVFVGIGSLFAFQQPPFVAPDETAHLGYAHEIADFRLPEIDREPAVPVAATQWGAERESARDERYLGVWVANHPPLSYVAAAPLVWVAELTERADGGLLLLRLANLGFAAIGLVFTYLFAVELTGGRRRIGVAAAAVAGLLPQGHVVFSQVMNDGLAFAASTAVLWCGVRVLRRGASRRELVGLGLAAVVAGGARTAAMMVAGLVVVYVAVVHAAGYRSNRRSPKVRARAAATIVAAGLIPPALLWGWFYLRNVALYGDIGASDYLLRRFRRRERGSVAEMMTNGHVWVRMYQRLLSPTTLRRVVPPGWWQTTAIGVVGVVLAAARGRTGDRDGRGDGGRPGEISRAGVGLAVLAVLVVAVTVAQHYSGGGLAHPRYLFPVLGVLATLFVLGVDRLAPVFGPTVVVVLLTVWATRSIPVDVDVTNKRPRDQTPLAPEALQTLPVGDGWRIASAVVVGAGCVAGAIALAASVATFALSQRVNRR